MGASSRTPLAAVHADRGAPRRFGTGPPDRGSAPPSIRCPGHVLCLSRAARAIAAKSALPSIGRRNSRLSGTHGRRFMSLRGGSRHRSRPRERNHEQARMVEHVNRSARNGQSTHRVACARRAVRVNLARRPGRGLSLSLISASINRAGVVRHSRPCLYVAYAVSASMSCRLRPGK